jgi:parallel beta-helix repeat protein
VTADDDAPYVGIFPNIDDIENSVTTDEDTDTTITLSPGFDLDDSSAALTYKVVLVEPFYGRLYQYVNEEKGARISSTTTLTPVTDSERRVIYEPVDRNSNYTDTLLSKVFNGDAESPNMETVTVGVAANDELPIITSSPEPGAKVDIEYSYLIEASDQDTNDILYFRAERMPSWLTLTDNGDGTATLVGTPTSEDVGTHIITIRVTDDIGLFTEQGFTIIVIPSEVLEIDAKDDLDNEITQNTSWNYDKVIIKAGDDNSATAITIRSNVTLTIEPGTIVEFQDGFGLQVSGGLLAVGSPEKAITFKGKEWGGISFNNASISSRLVYCNVEQVKGDFSGAISVINSSNVEVDHCTISANEAIFGGGIYLTNSNATITNNTITGNNDCQKGGGIYCINSNPTLVNNIITNNADCQKGGGIYLIDSNPTLSGNTITTNSAQDGGGIYCINSNPTLVNNIIANNSGTVKGGAMYCGNSNPILTNDTISGNLSPQGAGIFCESSSSPTLRNSILFGNNVAGDDGADTGEGEQVYLDDPGSEPIFQYCVVGGGVEAFNGQGAGDNYGGAYENNIDSDPQFVTPSSEAGTGGGGVWSLKAESPCINAGDTDLAGIPSTDVEGNPRSYNDVRVDIGAYEFQNNPPLLSPEESEAPPTDEDTSITITISDLTNAYDEDGHELTYKIVALPTYGMLYQFEDGNKGVEISFTDPETFAQVTDPDGRVFYEPANQSSDYTDIFSYKVRDEIGDEVADDLLEMDSVDAATVSILVGADNELPGFTSSSVEEANAGSEYRYEITAEDDDVDHPGTALIITPVLIPDWLTLTDNGDGTATLVGTPTDGEAGDYNVSIGVTDEGGGYTEQSFTITVNSQETLAVDAGPDISSEPGAVVFLKASGPEGDSVVYQWVVTDEQGNQIAEGAGIEFSWTPEEEGLYTAEATVSDDKGSVPGSDRVELIIAVGFIDVDDDHRSDPTTAQEEFINSVGALNRTGSDVASPDKIDMIAEVSQLNLDPAQRGNILAGIYNELETQEITDTQANKILGALDNLVIEQDASDTEKLTSTQVSQLVTCVDKIVDTIAMTKLQVPKAIEIINEMIEQQGGENISFDTRSLMRVVMEKIAQEGAALRSAVNASSRDHVKLTIRVVDLSSMTSNVEIGGDAQVEPRITVLSASAPEIMGNLGVYEVTITLLATDVSGVIEGILVSITLTGYTNEVLHVSDLETPFEIAIPVTDPSMVAPMYHDPTGVWSSEGISDVNVIDEGLVTFKVNHLTYFALLEGSAPSDGEEDTVDEVLNKAAGCFITTAAD